MPGHVSTLISIIYKNNSNTSIFNEQSLFFLEVIEFNDGINSDESNPLIYRVLLLPVLAF
jgi:hypothetical protein